MPILGATHNPGKIPRSPDDQENALNFNILLDRRIVAFGNYISVSRNRSVMQRHEIDYVQYLVIVKVLVGNSRGPKLVSAAGFDRGEQAVD